MTLLLLHLVVYRQVFAIIPLIFAVLLLKFNFRCSSSSVLNASLCKISSKSAKLFWDITIFRFSRWQQSAILNFQNSSFLVAFCVARANVYHRTKFHQNRPSGRWNGPTVFIIWFMGVHFGTGQEEYLEAFITVQILTWIAAVVSII